MTNETASVNGNPGTAVQAPERLTGEREVDHEHAPARCSDCREGAGHAFDAAIGQQRDVEVRRFLRVCRRTKENGVIFDISARSCVGPLDRILNRGRDVEDHPVSLVHASGGAATLRLVCCPIAASKAWSLPSGQSSTRAGGCSWSDSRRRQPFRGPERVQGSRSPSRVSISSIARTRRRSTVSGTP